MLKRGFQKILYFYFLHFGEMFYTLGKFQMTGRPGFNVQNLFKKCDKPH